MSEPELVAECVRAMRAATALPVTVKCRLGVDDQDTEQSLDRFADLMVDAGVDAIYVHARKAWLKGLSPKENRTVPPLDYARARRLAQQRATGLSQRRHRYDQGGRGACVSLLAPA